MEPLSPSLVNMLIIVLMLFFFSLQTVFPATWLDGFVTYYEFADQSVFSKNVRLKRSAAGQAGEILHNIRAFNTSFMLILKPDKSSFSGDHSVETGDGDLFKIDPSEFLVIGSVVGYGDSEVHGSLVDGRFEGEISVDGIKYYIENAEKFEKHRSTSGLSVAYRGDDVDTIGRSASRQRRSAGEDAGSSTCGWSHADIRSNMNFHHQPPAVSRQRREAPGTSQGTVLLGNPLSMPKICGIFMQVDHLLYKKFASEATTQYNAIANIMSYLNFVMKMTNKIYLATNFTTADGVTAGPYRNVQMAVVRTKIYQTETQFARAFQVQPNEHITNLDPTNFLNLISRNNYNLYCASFVLTFREFSNGVLGLAWIHYPDSMQRGGVCDRFGPTRYGMQSLNSGIVTHINYGEPVNRLVSSTTFAHELGHSFGAQHDNAAGEAGQIADPRCYPGGSQGNYIMYSSANSGDRPNNQRFSYCSRDMIAKNLFQITTNPGSVNCFKTSVQFCGNGIVDPGEECDCGFGEDCVNEIRCCGPADDPNPAARCKLRYSGAVKVQCSPSNGACCDGNTCSFRARGDPTPCSEGDECLKRSFCDGNSASCPRGTPEPDGKFCGDLTKICRNGECSVSSCEAILNRSASVIYQSCQAERPTDNSKYNRSELCFLSCRSSSSGQCYNSAHAADKNFNIDFKAFLDKVNNGRPIQLMAGAPCDADRGYCDVFRKCRPINTEGPLSRLRDVLFSESSLSTIRTWIEKHWWAVLLICIAVIGFMVAFVKICSVHTPTDNRNLRQPSTAFRRASFRPMFVHSGPPQGRGPGRQVPTVSGSMPPALPPRNQKKSKKPKNKKKNSNSSLAIPENETATAETVAL